MKIKDLDPNTNLTNIKVKTTDGKVGYWKSQWGYPDGKAGVWLVDNIGDSRVNPVFLENLKESLEWEVLTD